VVDAPEPKKLTRIAPSRLFVVDVHSRYAHAVAYRWWFFYFFAPMVKHWQLRTVAVYCDMGLPLDCKNFDHTKLENQGEKNPNKKTCLKNK